MTRSDHGSPYRVAAPRPPAHVEWHPDGIDYGSINAPLWPVDSTSPSQPSWQPETDPRGWLFLQLGLDAGYLSLAWLMASSNDPALFVGISVFHGFFWSLMDLLDGADDFSRARLVLGIARLTLSIAAVAYWGIDALLFTAFMVGVSALWIPFFAKPGELKAFVKDTGAKLRARVARLRRADVELPVK